MRAFCLSFFAAFLLQVSQAQFRKYSNEFLNIGVGAQGLAMGGAEISLTEDAMSGYWNPAGLAWIYDRPEAGLMHADYFAGIAKYDFAGLAIPVKDSRRTIGFSLLRFAVDDIPNTLFLVEPDGTINYNNVRSFSSADYAFLFSLAQRIKEDDDFFMSFGAGTKVIYRKVGNFASAWGFGLDAGLQMHGRKWHAAAVIKDLTTTFNAWSFKFTEKEKEILYLTRNDIPVYSTELTAPRLSLGGSYDVSLGASVTLKPALDLDFTFGGRRNTLVSSRMVNVDPHLGLQANIKDVFFVRGGIANFQQALADGDTLNQKKVWIYQPSIGAGFVINNVTIDYAFSNLANQANPLYSHIFSLRIDLGKKQD